MAGRSGREISAVPEGGIKEKLVSWEGALVLILVGVNILGVVISPNYNLNNVLREMPRYLAEIFMMFGMGYILVLGDIDISVGALVCLAGTVTVLSSNAGAPFIVAVLICLLVGLMGGMLNGFISTHFTELPTMIVTLGTQIIFRGIAEVLFETWGNGGGTASMTDTKGLMLLAKKVGPFPISFFCVIIVGIIMITVLAKTTFGRKLYAIGSNKTAAYYAGIKVERIRFICYSLLGLLAGLCALFLLTATFGSNTTTGQGFEMEVIAMCVFGGIATTGGKGNLIGGFIAAFIIVCLRIALGQRNINTQVILVIIGLMLIISVLVPSVSNALSAKRKKAGT